MSNRTRAKVSSETSATSNGVNHKSSSSNNNKKGSLKQMERQRLRAERESLKLWLHPKDTSKYFLLECLTLARIYGRKFLHNKLYIAMIFTAALLLVVAFHIPGEHQKILETVKGHILFATYWLGLGVISSVGLGTGLHTFLLYLGPHIASVTLAAYECNSLDFPKPPYPDEIICPESTNANFVPSLWNIMSKVRLEAFLWGAGTALGELPPYFMAKAARLSGIDPDDDENNLKEFEELQKKRATGQHLSILEKGKLFMERIVERVGFFGILACASIPNPLFDLAGITCGHFLVPFATFFGATLIGKAIIKMHIQKIFVIMAFNEPLIAKVVDKIGHVPVVGGKLQEPFKAFLAVQKTRYHRKSANTKVPERANLLARLFEILVIAMILYFVLSIINAFAQNYHKRLHKKKQNTNSLKNKPKKD